LTVLQFVFDFNNSYSLEPVQRESRRVSTRPRATKKHDSDFEELNSSDEESEEIYDDDEEEDPNFSAEAECINLLI
jgi:hypothetical protein